MRTLDFDLLERSLAAHSVLPGENVELIMTPEDARALANRLSKVRRLTVLDTKYKAAQQSVDAGIKWVRRVWFAQIVLCGLFAVLIAVALL